MLRLFYVASVVLPVATCWLWPVQYRGLSLTALLGLKLTATNYAAFVVACVMTMLLQTGPVVLLGLSKHEKLAPARVMGRPLLATLLFRLGQVPVLIAAGLGVGRTVALSSLTASVSEMTTCSGGDVRSLGFTLVLRILRNAYLAYVYVMTGSAYAVYAAQVIVELCGVPDLMVFEKTHAAYSHRLLVIALTAVGLTA